MKIEDMKIPKKEKMIIELLSNVFFKSLDNQEKISILCEALIISSSGTKHHHSAMELIERVDSEFLKT